MIRAWWSAREQRERRMLSVGALITGALLGWAFIWHPLALSRAELASSLEDQRRSLAEMRAAATEVAHLRSTGAQAKVERQGKSLFALADATARGAALAGALKRVEPLSENSVRVSFELASFDALMNWLEGMARDFGVQATDLSIDRADGVGLVNARVTLQDS